MIHWYTGISISEEIIHVGIISLRFAPNIVVVRYGLGRPDALVNQISCLYVFYMVCALTHRSIFTLAFCVYRQNVTLFGAMKITLSLTFWFEDFTLLPC